VVSTRAAGDAELTDTIHRARELLGAQEPGSPAAPQRPRNRPPIQSTDESPQVKP
jgi:hypothetical protein